MFIPDKLGKDKVEVVGQWDAPEIVALWVNEPSSPTPIQAKALYVFGLMLRNIFAAEKLLTHPDGNLYADFFFEAYLMACTAIEVLGCCLRAGKADPQDNLKEGFNKFLKISDKEPAYGEDPLVVNPSGSEKEGYSYTVDELVHFRNFVAHGRKLSGWEVSSHKTLHMHIEILDAFPRRFKQVLDEYHDELKSSKQAQKLLANAHIYPHYLDDVGQNRLFMPPHYYAYKELVEKGQKPGDLITRPEWNVYKDSYERSQRGK